jgi:acetylglutamate kinase
MSSIIIIKIGGAVVDDEPKLGSFLKALAAVPGKKILVHGGGKLATRMAEQAGIPQQMVEGRRITDAETLKIVTMVYAGYINKNIVAQLQASGCNAIGIAGADGNAILAHKRKKGTVDYGFAGDVDEVNVSFIYAMLEQCDALVVAPITHDGKGQLLNTNADTIAQSLATGLSPHFEVSLVYTFEKSGVLRDAEDDRSVIRRIDRAVYAGLKEHNLVFAGMIPKLDNAFAALDSGVKRVIIGKAEDLLQLISGKGGTTIAHG